MPPKSYGGLFVVDLFHEALFGGVRRVVTRTSGRPRLQRAPTTLHISGWINYSAYKEVSGSWWEFGSGKIYDVVGSEGKTIPGDGWGRWKHGENDSSFGACR